MTMITNTSFLFILFVFLSAVSGVTAPLNPLCGEWTGTRPPQEYNRPYEHDSIFTFRPDNSFLLACVEKQIPGEYIIVPEVEGGYSVTPTNVILRLPKMNPVPLAYVIEGTNLNFDLSLIPSELRGMMGGITSYRRTKNASELPIEKKQTLLTEGVYEIRVTIDKDNDQDELKKVLGDKFEAIVGVPISGGKYPLYQFQGRNILLFGNYSVRFRPPEFSGNTFKIEGYVIDASYGYGKLSGKIVSTTKVEGSFKSSTSSLHGTFVMERVGSVSPYPTWIQQGQIGP